MNNFAIFFASKTVVYEKYAKIQAEVATEAIKFANDQISQIQNELWLDLGSGTGLARKKLSENFNKTKIISLDIAFSDKINVCADFDFLPFADNSFDGIISCSALQWSKNMSSALKNSYNALKNNKKFILAVFGAKTLEKLQFLQDKFGIKPLVKFYEKENLEKIIQNTGFNIAVQNEKTFSQKFDSAYDALKSISKIGATKHNGKILPPKSLKEFVLQYENLFLPDKITHEYRTLFYVLEKKNETVDS
jgi:malonyl-CoA O-methyltransferase